METSQYHCHGSRWEFNLHILAKLIWKHNICPINGLEGISLFRHPRDYKKTPCLHPKVCKQLHNHFSTLISVVKKGFDKGIGGASVDTTLVTFLFILFVCTSTHRTAPTYNHLGSTFYASSVGAVCRK